MKLVIDLFPCQTKFRHRGIGRYSLSISLAMTEQRKQNEMIILADPLYPESFEELRQKFIRLLPAGSFLPYYHPPVEFDTWKKYQSTNEIAQTLIKQAYQTVSPDIVLNPSFIEGLGEHGCVPLPEGALPSYKKVAILYDLIPYIFHQQYLDPNPEIKTWYLKRIGLLQNFDLLLAISESTRQDAIRLLGLHPDKIVNISGAASPIFKKLDISPAQKQDFLMHFNIKRPYVLYIGGDDFRKNMDGALTAFAQLPHDVKSAHQLVLNDVGDQTVFREKARKLGVEDDNIIITGRVNDDELVKLYNLCKLSIFPSRYEGFGLPILEAMACGAPVIASNNSSIPEIISRSDAMFDVSSDQNIANFLTLALQNDNFLNELANYGLERVKGFSWGNSAQHAWDAIITIEYEKTDFVSRTISISNSQLRTRIAYVSPLPPDKSGIADYSAKLLPYLSEYFIIDLFTGPDLKLTDPYIQENLSCYSWTELPDRRDLYDTVIFQMGNSHFHTHMLDLLKEIPGVVVLHDFYLSNLATVLEFHHHQNGAFIEHLDFNHGLIGIADMVENGLDFSRREWPMNWEIIRYAQEIIVHSVYQLSLMDRFYGHGWKPKPALIPQLRNIPPEISEKERSAIITELKINPSKFIFCSYGFIASTKLNLITLQAFAKFLTGKNENALLILVGELDSGDYGRQILNTIKELGLNDYVRITGYVDDETFTKYLYSADIAIQLRTDSRGETSSALLYCMANGISTIINAHGSFKEYSSEYVMMIPDPPTVDHLVQAMNKLFENAELRTRIGQQARKYIAENHNPKMIAEAYAKVIHHAIRTNERELFKPLIDSLFQIDLRDRWLRESAMCAAANLSLHCQPRILLEVFNSDVFNYTADKQNALVESIKELLYTGNKSLHLELIYMNDGKIFRACRLVEEILGLKDQSLGPEKLISIEPGDILVTLVDSSQSRLITPEIMGKIRKKGGRILSIISKQSELYLYPALKESDAIVCFSYKTAAKFASLIDAYRDEVRREIDIYYIYDSENERADDSLGTTSKKLLESGFEESFETSSLEKIAMWSLNELMSKSPIKQFN